MIPELNRTALIALAKAVIWGGVAGALPFLLVTVPIGMAMVQDGQAGGFWIMLVPLWIAWPATLAGTLAIGLPLTVLLARSGHERGRFYVLAGLIAGSLPFLLAGLFPDMIGWMAFSIPGGLAGAVAGWHWGRHRDWLAAQPFVGAVDPM